MSQPTATASRRRLTAAERAERNRRITEARATGEPWGPIAAREGLSVKQARRAAADHLESEIAAGPRRLSDIDGPALLVKIIDAQERALSAALREMTAGDNSSARVGAARTVSTVGATLHQTLHDAGLVGGASLMRYVSEIEAFVRMWFDLAARYGVPTDVIQQELDAVPLPAGVAWAPAIPLRYPTKENP